MLVSIIGSLKENFTKKVRNPFFGTLTVVFILKNWQLFYSLLFFDSYDGRTTRIEIIEEYIEVAGGTWMFARAVCWTFVVLIISYLLQGLGAFISNVYDSRLHPWIISIATKGVNVVTKEKYELEVQKNKVLETRLKEEREKRYSVENELERVEKKRSEPVEYVSSLPLISELNHEDKVVKRLADNDWLDEFSRLIVKIADGLTPAYANANYEQQFISYLLAQEIIYIENNMDEYENYHPTYHFSDFGNSVKKLFTEKTA